MKVLDHLADLGSEKAPVCLAIGMFDGVHMGHRRVLQQAVTRASRLGGTAWALTFDSHPLATVHPEAAPLLLTSCAQKLSLLSQAGIEGCVLLPFTRALAATQPEDFAAMLCGKATPLRMIFVGRDWRFGRGRRGNAALLARLCGRCGLRVRIVPALRWRGRPVSSTRIRQAVLRGAMREAAAMLGRPFSMVASVARGRGVGRSLGFPTANLLPEGRIRPPSGVYAARARIGASDFNSLLYVGTRPTFPDAGGGTTLELHLPGVRMDLYGKRLEVSLLARLRGDRKFPSIDALKDRMARDVASAAAICGAARWQPRRVARTAREKSKIPFACAGTRWYSPPQQKRQKRRRETGRL